MRHLVSFIIVLFCSMQILKAQTPEELKSWLPAVEGWTISDKVEVFDPDNLFDRINGAAPLYLENNFREMTSMEYIDDEDSGGYITIQAYRHATPEDAFGMYASERSSDLRYFPFAGEAQGDDTNMFFFAGCMYVKMWCSTSENISAQMQAIASVLAKRIAPEAGYPTVINAFPKEEKIPHTETYVTANYIGHEFLNSVYTTNYKKDDKEYQAFIVDAKTTEKAKEVLSKYFAFTLQLDDFSEGNLTIKDRYNGDIPALWKGQYIIGIFSENGSKMKDADALLKEIAANLPSE